jgi:hypothetical protein
MTCWLSPRWVYSARCWWGGAGEGHGTAADAVIEVAFGGFFSLALPDVPAEQYSCRASA